MSEKVDPAIALANRVNSSLGDELVKLKLVEMEAKEKAIPLLKEQLVKGEIKRASLLKILCWDLKVLEEKEVMDHLIEDLNLGYCNLMNYQVKRDKLPHFRINECWATMSIPIDFLEGVFFVTTSHYYSAEARLHWERRLNRPIIWMISDLSSMTMTLEKLEKIEAKELAEEEEKRKLRKSRSPFASLTRSLVKEDDGEEVMSVEDSNEVKSASPEKTESEAPQ